MSSSQSGMRSVSFFRASGLALTAFLAFASPPGVGRASAAAPPACDGTASGGVHVLELAGPAGSVMLVGTQHRTDPADPVWDELERRVVGFKPTRYLVESLGKPAASREEAIQRGGESAFVCWLAAQQSAACGGLDLPESEEVARLRRKHTAEEVLLLKVIQVVAYFNPRPPDQRPPGDPLVWALKRYAPMAGLPDATPADIERICQQVLHRPWVTSEVTTEWHDPRRSDMLTQVMSQESNALREPYMLEQLLSAAGPGHRVFATVGEGHVCDLWSELSKRWAEVRPSPKK